MWIFSQLGIHFVPKTDAKTDISKREIWEVIQNPRADNKECFIFASIPLTCCDTLTFQRSAVSTPTLSLSSACLEFEVICKSVPGTLSSRVEQIPVVETFLLHFFKDALLFCALVSWCLFKRSVLLNTITHYNMRGNTT